MNFRIRRLASAALALTTLPGAVLAQQVDAPGFRPGRVGEAFEQPAQPHPGLELSVPEGGGGAAVPEAEQIQLSLTALAIDGATVYSEAELAPLYEDLLRRRSVTLADVYRVAEAITLKYREDGYVLSRALVPAQRIRGGTVRLQVIEGYIDQVAIESEDIAAESRLRDAVAAHLEALTTARPARIQDVERALLLINDLSGVNARSVIRPAAAGVGASELVVVAEHAPVSGSATIENYASRYTGRLNALGELHVNSPLGLGERVTARVLAAAPASELTYYQLGGWTPIGASGLNASLSGFFSEAQPGWLLDPWNVESTTWGAEGALGYPIIRSRSQNLTVQAGGRYRKVSTDIPNLPVTGPSELYSQDEVAAGSANLTYDFADSLLGVNLVGISLSAGAQNSFSAVGRAREPHDGFTKLTGEFVRQQGLTENLSLVVAGEWQYAAVVLVSSEKFAVGGKNFGRGYDPAEIQGESGVATKTELRWTGTTGWEALGAYTAYAFYDFGAVWREDAPLVAGTRDVRRSLASAGIGLQASVYDRFSARIEVAHPLTRLPAAADEREPEFLFSVSAKF